MSTYPPGVWDQVKNTTHKELMRALKKDGFTRDEGKKGAIIVFRNPADGRRIAVEIHWKSGQKTYGPKLLKAILDDAGWTTVDDLRRVGLIK